MKACLLLNRMEDSVDTCALMLQMQEQLAFFPDTPPLTWGHWWERAHAHKLFMPCLLPRPPTCLRKIKPYKGNFLAFLVTKGLINCNLTVLLALCNPWMSLARFFSEGWGGKTRCGLDSYYFMCVQACYRTGSLVTRQPLRRFHTRPQSGSFPCLWKTKASGSQAKGSGVPVWCQLILQHRPFQAAYCLSVRRNWGTNDMWEAPEILSNS